MDEAPRVAPVEESQRIALLDVLRGFAVLGILIANIPYMAMAGAITAPYGHYAGGDHWTDQASQTFVFLFADSKFITLFSTLFGAGLALMSEKALAAEVPFNWRYLRRLAVLFLFGVAHITLLWFGDILLMYSLIGFAAMWFRRCRVKALLVWATVLLTLNGILWALFSFLEPSDFVTLEKVDGKELSAEESVAMQTDKIRKALSSGDFVEIAKMRLGLYAGAGIVMMFVFAMRTLALFLIGIAAIKSGILSRFMTDRRILFRMLAIGLGVGLPIQIASHVAVWDMSGIGRRMVFWVGWYLAGLFMATGYVAACALWMHTNSWLGLRARLAAVGRMALTNYLTHSLITSILFNYLGYFDTWRRPSLLLLVFGIFVFQLWISPIWLRSFLYGPCEWLWRSATYGRWMAMRRS